jgi:hypothetical protein
MLGSFVPLQEVRRWAQIHMWYLAMFSYQLPIQSTQYYSASSHYHSHARSLRQTRYQPVQRPSKISGFQIKLRIHKVGFNWPGPVQSGIRVRSRILSCNLRTLAGGYGCWHDYALLIV